MALKEYLQQQYQGRESFLTNVVFPMFGEDLFEDGFNESVLSIKPELVPLAQSSGIESILRIGTINVDFNPIDIYDITVSDKVQMQRNRVSIQMLVRRIMDTYSSSFMIFHYKDNSSWDWRFTFCSKKGNNEDSTDSKRYTFLLGPNQSCRTAAENFEKLIQIEDKGSITVESIISAFDVEALSKEFFGKYKEHYSKFVAHMCDESNGMRDDFIDDSFDKTGLDAAKIKDKEEKPIRDYVKRLLGRIVFLHFLQKKGWMGVPAGKNWGDGDKDFMMSLYESASESQRANFLDEILEPLFSEALNTDRTSDGDLFDTRVNLSNGSKVRVPYLNGGLFERDKYDEPKTVFPAEYFKDLLEFFYQYNFTIDENDPNDAQVGVDPEMLGRIFENLLEDNKDKGAFYTPKEIVQYMCRQALVAYLQTNEDDTVKSQIENFVTTYDVGEIGGADSDLARTLDQKLKEVKICDPAIGSGAFPMGLLKELFLCRGAIENFDNASDIKKHIIQNNIYGVDIEKGAVDIARLRFWLSLIVDEDTPSALPNLDYKIMQGNSLLESYKGVDLSQLTAEKKEISEGHQLTFFEDESDLQRLNLRKLLDDYYNCPDHNGKTELKKKISDCIQTQLDFLNLSCQGKYGENKIDLSKIDIAGNDQFFLWHTWFSDVFNRPSDCDKSGFDIVIGNPPYIAAPAQIANPILAEQRQRLLKCGHYETLYQKWDLYVPFMEKGLKMLCANGSFAMIVPFPLSNQKYGLKFRKWVVENYDMIEISDLNGTKVFENATVSNVILFIQNIGKTRETKISHINERLEFSIDFSQPISTLVQDEKKYVWNFSQERRKTNVHTDMHVLGDFCYITKGMVLNADEKTAKGKFKKENLISETKDEQHTRKYIEAKDIEKYAVKRVRYLEYDTPRCPGELSRPTFRELYDRNKIIINRLGNLQAIIDCETHFLLSDSTLIAVLWKDLKGVDNKSLSASVKRYSHHSRKEMEEFSEAVCLEYLIAILNSSYAAQLLATLRGDDYHIYPEHIRNIPIPSAPSVVQTRIKHLVHQIIEYKQSGKDCIASEKELDEMILELYKPDDSDEKK